jgi:dihydropteroate synthase
MSKNTVLPVQTTLQSRGRLLDLSQPIVMGILNATPNSFYTKGRDSKPGGILKQAGKMLAEGATILDLGGATTKPGAALIAPEEELKRIIPALEQLLKHFPDAWISIDTYNAQVAREAVDTGASIINDVSSGRFDNTMIETVASLKVPYIAMHMQGTPETMQQNPQYGDVITEVRSYLAEVNHQCTAAGIADVIIDPGFGFGKTVAHNFALLRQLDTFRMLGRPILAGLSRKSMICKTLNINPENALNGTTALHMAALERGANILRVHDVKEAMEVLNLYRYLSGDNG